MSWIDALRNFGEEFDAVYGASFRLRRAVWAIPLGPSAILLLGLLILPNEVQDSPYAALANAVIVPVRELALPLLVLGMMLFLIFRTWDIFDRERRRLCGI